MYAKMARVKLLPNGGGRTCLTSDHTTTGDFEVTLLLFVYYILSFFLIRISRTCESFSNCLTIDLRIES